ncbi:MAG: dihydrodipicolinate synthase family protein [Myxococcota bacterium]
MNDRVISLSQTLFSDSNPIPVKAGMAMAGWCSPALRLPLLPATEAVRMAVMAAINVYRGQPESTSLKGFLS